MEKQGELKYLSTVTQLKDSGLRNNFSLILTLGGGERTWCLKLTPGGDPRIIFVPKIELGICHMQYKSLCLLWYLPSPQNWSIIKGLKFLFL